MAKFKKGDRVRAVEGNPWVKKGLEGVVDEEDTIPWVKWDNGDCCAISEGRLELITKTENMNNVKIAVSFENDSEKIYYLSYCVRLGHELARLGTGVYIGAELSERVISFDGNLIQYKKESALKSGFQIIPFKVFAALKGIDYNPEVTVKLNDQYTATILDDKVKVGCHEFEFERIEALYKAIQESKK